MANVRGHNEGSLFPRRRDGALLAVAGALVGAAVVLASRDAPRLSGDLVQLWLVPDVSAGGLQLGLRNGIGEALTCDLTVVAPAQPPGIRTVRVEPGATFETILAAAPGTAAQADVTADCRAGSRTFTRHVAVGPRPSP